MPLHLQQCFAYLGQGAGASPIRRRCPGDGGAAHLSGTDAEQLQYVVDSIARFYVNGAPGRPSTPGP